VRHALHVISRAVYQLLLQTQCDKENSGSTAEQKKGFNDRLLLWNFYRFVENVIKYFLANVQNCLKSNTRTSYFCKTAHSNLQNVRLIRVVRKYTASVELKIIVRFCNAAKMSEIEN